MRATIEELLNEAWYLYAQYPELEGFFRINLAEESYE